MKINLVWNKHPSKWGERTETMTRDGKFSKQHRSKSNSQKPGYVFREQMAAQHWEAEILTYNEPQRAEKVHFNKKTTSLASLSHLPVESPHLAGPIGSVKTGPSCWQYYLTVTYILFSASRTLSFPFHGDSKQTEKWSLVVSGDGHHHTDLALTSRFFSVLSLWGTTATACSWLWLYLGVPVM